MSVAAEVTFSYDGDGNMIIREAGDGAKTIYIGNYLEIDIPAEGTQTPTPTLTAASTATATQTATPTATACQWRIKMSTESR